jgi:hypothetical protein
MLKDQAALARARAKDQAALARARAKEQTALARARAKDHAAAVRAAAKDQAALARARAKEQAALARARAKDQAALARARAKEQAARARARAKDQAARARARAKDQAALARARAKDRQAALVAAQQAVREEVEDEGLEIASEAIQEQQEGDLDDPEGAGSRQGLRRSSRTVKAPARWGYGKQHPRYEASAHSGRWCSRRDDYISDDSSAEGGYTDGSGSPSDDSFIATDDEEDPDNKAVIERLRGGRSRFKGRANDDPIDDLREFCHLLLAEVSEHQSAGYD